MTVSIEDIYPLSPLQQGFLFHAISETDPGLYVEQMSWTFRGRLNLDAFTQAWASVIARHPILRTTFEWEGLDQPLQVVHADAALPLEVLDWRGLPPDAQQSRMDALLADECRRPFDLHTAPMMRLLLVHLGGDRQDFIWTSHHLLLDGWSVPVLLDEFFDFYEAHRERRHPFLAPTRPYRDYISWLAEQDPEAARGYWRDVLAGAEVPTPLPQQAGSAGPPQSHAVTLQLSTATTEALAGLARHQRVTSSTIFQSVWALLLARYSGREDVVFGSVVSGRPPALDGVETMVGLFINALPLRVKIPHGETSIASWWQELQAQQAEQRQYEFCSLVDIRQWAGLPAGRPLFDTLVGFENYPVPRGPRRMEVSQSETGARITDIRSSSRTTYALTAIVGPGPPLHLRLLYDPSRIEEATVLRMLDHLRNMLELCAEQPGQSPRSIAAAAMPAAERHTIEEWSTVTADYPRDTAVHDLFARQASRNPNRIAIEFSGETMTYEELEKRANQLARFLTRSGAAAGTPVAVCLARSVDFIVALLAALKAGCAYVPLDPGYPAARLRMMLEDSGAGMVITTEAARGEWVPAANAVFLDAHRAAIAEEDDSAFAAAGSTGELPAYIMYTSGSTGRPKGTVIQHRAIARLVLSTNYLQLTPDDRVAQASNASFDAATFEIWGPLLTGGTVVGIQREDLLDADRLEPLLREQRITVLFLTTGLFHQLAHDRPEVFASLDCLLFGGERADRTMVNDVLLRGRPRRLLHVYGPTESTTFATWHEVQEPSDEESVPIGKPLANTEVHLLDAAMNVVPIGAPGEICLGGDGLALCYLNDPELTAERFVPHPFRDGARLYRTGDLGRHRSDGAIEFLGRRDHQVKLRGFRVEPAEVEAAIRAHPRVRDAAVVTRRDGTGELRLLAYAVAPDVAEEELRRHVARTLPAFMIPSSIVFLEALPLNANGKVDRDALPSPQFNGGNGHPPQTAVEERMLAIWREVLGRESIGVDQNFFELGGHSLNAIRLISRIRDEFEIDLPVRSLFYAPVAVQLAGEVEERLIAKLESLTEDDALRMLERGNE